MQRLHIKGVVRAANHVRQMLSAPMTAAQRECLRRQIRDSIAQVEDILARNRAQARQLPGPTRRALQFLRQVELDHVEVQDADDAMPGVGQETVWFPGLRSFFDRLLDDVALNVHADTYKHEATVQVLRRTTDRLNHTFDRENYQPEHLKPESRRIFAWLRTFAEDPMFELYVDAVRRAQRTWAKLPFQRHHWHPPFLVHFRPSRNLYRARPVDDGLRIVLETPMVTFKTEVFTRLGRQMLGSGDHHEAVTEAMMAPEYQELVQRMERAVGVVEHTKGVAHDIEASFARVNARYFGGQLERPRLKWTRTITRCTFGHYDFVHDTLWISRTLDRPDVPEYVFDHVMHHELLHKKHGIAWRGRRQHAHTPAFREEERRFERYDQAAEYLNKLSAATR
jgi:hypothetical protein